MILEQLKQNVRVKILADCEEIHGLTGKISHWFPQANQFNRHGKCPHGKYSECFVVILTDKPYPDPEARNKVACERCQGAKIVNGEPCFKCAGKGFTEIPIMRDKTTCCMHELEKLHLQDAEIEKQNEQDTKQIEKEPDHSANADISEQDDPWANFPGGRPF